MRRQVAQYGLFFREFVRNFHTTGAVLPSGPFLASALARFVENGSDGPRGILEVGPGTGAVTGRIVDALGSNDRLDLVELNDSFVDQLRSRFENDPAFQPVADRARVLHCAIEELPDGQKYDVIVSGLPLNNFAAETVQQILGQLIGLLKPGGTLSFFQYIAIRRAKVLISRGSERTRLQGIGQAMAGVLDEHEIRRDWIWPNIPPAWVHHLRV